MRLIVILGIMFSTCLQAAENGNGTVEWGYEGNSGPAKWGLLSPANTSCSVGQSQSPINITTTAATTSEKNLLQVNYQPAPLMIMDDGTTDLKIGRQTLKVNLGHTVQINFPDTRETMEFAGKTYRLLQFHFHVPAENELDGKSFSGEIHFVNQGSWGHVAVIAVFIKQGQSNPAIQQILDNLPKTNGKLELAKEARIDPAVLLPENKSYYSFIGSLTTPPCSEGIRWIVMANPIEASAAQIDRLHYAIGEDNARPIQPLNQRKILYVEPKPEIKSE